MKRKTSIGLMLREMPFLKQSIKQVNSYVSQNFNNYDKKLFTLSGAQPNLKPIQPIFEEKNLAEI